MNILCLLLVVSFGVGCVERTIRITSTPSGALLYLNDEEVGRTPLVVPFTYYGVYDVRLEKEGYKPNWTTERADAPWWEYPGPDLIAEAIPDATSELQWHFFLEPDEDIEEIDPDMLKDRAGQLRSLLRQQSETPRR